MKKLKLFIIILVALFTLPPSINAIENLEMISSDWKLEEESLTDKPGISVMELIEAPIKKKKIEKEIVKEKALLEEEIARMQARRKVLIECLNQKGVILFTSKDRNCKYCKKQEKFFGEDLELLKGYINCDKARFTCPMRSIKVYPTWYLGHRIGLKKEGVQDLEKLARLTKCEY